MFLQQCTACTFCLVRFFFQLAQNQVGISQGPTFILFCLFRPYVYSFCQIFQALRLFPALRLFRSLEQFDIYGPSEWDFTNIGSFIKWQYLFHSEVKSFLKEKNYFATLFTLSWSGFKIKSRQKVKSANDKLNMTNIFAIIECFKCIQRTQGFATPVLNAF